MTRAWKRAALSCVAVDRTVSCQGTLHRQERLDGAGIREDTDLQSSGDPGLLDTDGTLYVAEIRSPQTSTVFDAASLARHQQSCPTHRFDAVQRTRIEYPNSCLEKAFGVRAYRPSS